VDASGEQGGAPLRSRVRVVREPRRFWPPPPRVVMRCGAAAALTVCLVSYVLYLTLDGLWIPELDVDSEGSVAAWLSSVALFACALVLSGIARRQEVGQRAWWIGLAAVFSCLSLDEVASIHEKASDPLRHALSTSGPLLHAWVIPASVAIVVGTVVFLPLLRRLHRQTSGLFTAGGVLYFSGAIGLEGLGGAITGPRGVPDLRYAAVATTEELFEMLGITMFLAALARYDAAHLPGAVAPAEPISREWSVPTASLALDEAPLPDSA
jgi:hypothetical protein